MGNNTNRGTCGGARPPATHAQIDALRKENDRLLRRIEHIENQSHPQENERPPSKQEPIKWSKADEARFEMYDSMDQKKREDTLRAELQQAREEIGWKKLCPKCEEHYSDPNDQGCSLCDLGARCEGQNKVIIDLQQQLDQSRADFERLEKTLRFVALERDNSMRGSEVIQRRLDEVMQENEELRKEKR